MIFEISSFIENPIRRICPGSVLEEKNKQRIRCSSFFPQKYAHHVNCTCMALHYRVKVTIRSRILIVHVGTSKTRSDIVNVHRKNIHLHGAVDTITAILKSRREHACAYTYTALCIVRFDSNDAEPQRCSPFRLSGTAFHCSWLLRPTLSSSATVDLWCVNARLMS